MAQNEITASCPVLDAEGRPLNFGWARSPLLVYDKNLVDAPSRRISESDRYIIYSPTHLLIFEILDHGYFGHIGISVISLKDKKRSTQSYRVPFSMGELSANREDGSIRARLKKMSVEFIMMEGSVRIIKVDIPKFGHHHFLRGAVVLSGRNSLDRNSPESIVTNMPWHSEKNAFRYSQVSPWYSAEGVMQFGATEIHFTKDNAWGIFDWSRGVRPRRSVHYWAAGCGLSEGRQIGFSAGYGSADSANGTENAFFLDGRIHKLDQVTFHIPLNDWLLPWRFISNDKKLEMTFTPHQERSDHNQWLLHSLHRHQVIGSFSGHAIIEGSKIDGKTGGKKEINFTGITGIAEHRKTRY
ncbi:hypothetical protein FACS1894151_07170 [Spirochaetia bacterium]|nr:hypothetical protein FACS1894151_07170 [Spirochaetia bacterium]